MPNALNPKDVAARLAYDPATGKLFWRRLQDGVLPSGKYSSERKTAAWNALIAGSEALTCICIPGKAIG